VKIALVILHADAARGGAERYTLDLAKALVRRGHDVSILASSFQKAPTAGKRVLLYAPGWTRTGRYDTFNMALIEAVVGDTPDVIHAMLPVVCSSIYHPHAGIATEAVVAGHLNKSGALRRAIAWIGNHTNRRRLRFATMERRILSDPKWPTPTVLCLSNLIKGVVKWHYPSLPDDKLVSLFNGIDLTKFDPALRPESRQLIRDRFSITHDEVVGLMLAQDFERKGLRQAIEALAKAPGLVLLVGGKPDPAKYRQLAKSLGVSDRVIFAGQVDDPVAFYQAADFFVLPTRFDPCSLVVLEALAMGLPVISTVRNGACEIMRDGVHGRVLSDADDLGALGTALLEMTDPAKRLEMSRACLALRQELSIEAHLNRLEQVYTSIISKR
jgi:UDP-glucose:(heptosyl)LPS alpha-1,3-glucosyltransferase